MAKFRVWVEVKSSHADFSEDVITVADETWQQLSPSEREKFMQEAFEAALFEVANGGYEEIEE